MASVAVYFVSKAEYQYLSGSYDWDWHESNRNRFNGYIDDTHGDYVLVDAEQGLYKRAVWDYLNSHTGKQIKDIDLAFMWRTCVITDEFCQHEAHLQKWQKLFADADPESYLLLEFH